MMKRILFLTLVICIGFNLKAKEYFVSPSGKDSNKGSKESPFKTINTAIKHLKPGGKVLLTSICQDGSPGFQALNIWCSMSEGYGPLPHPDQLSLQLKKAGFVNVTTKRLIPFDSFWAFVATKA